MWLYVLGGKMRFLVSLETSTRGEYTLGHLDADSKKSAQEKIVKKLKDVGFPIEKIGVQVTDNTTLEIGVHRINIVPIGEFNTGKAITLATLLQT
jgi:hypothetical protein